MVESDLFSPTSDLCGDLDIDLLLIETNNNYQQFYDMIFSYGFLPKSIQPTRVTVHNSSLIDNIFRNSIIDDTTLLTICICKMRMT